MKRGIRGIRDNIPSGYVIGRASSGTGAAELIPMAGLSAGIGGSPGGGSGSGGGGSGGSPGPQPVSVTYANPTATVSGTAVNGSALSAMRSDAAPALADTAVTAGSYTAANITVDAQGRLTAASDGSGATGANPTATVSGTVVDGSATTFMRSDGAPALADTAVTAGSYTSANITVDAQGRLTAASDGSGATGANPTATVSGSVVDGSATTFMRSDGAPALADTAVTAGSYTSANITVDAQGRLTAASDGSGATGANPTATVSGTVVDGSATTFMRSDGAPALADTAVTAGSYTSANITVDAQGRLTAASDGSGATGANPTATVSGTVVDGSATTFMRSDGAPALADTAVTAGSYTSANITVDAQGRLTAASDGSGVTFANEGTWVDTDSYSVGNVVQFGGSSYLCYVAVASGSPTYTAWNPSGTGSNISLSETNIADDTATASTSATTVAQGAGGASTGKYYFEVTAVSAGSSDGIGVSLGAFYANPTTPGYGAVLTAAGGYYNGNASTESMDGWVGGQVVGIAVDFGAALIWFMVPNEDGKWNGSATADPATGVGGFALWTGFAGDTMYPCVQVSGSGHEFILNTGDVTFNFTQPTGFGTFSTGAANELPTADTAHWLAQGQSNYLSSVVASTSAVALTSGTTANVTSLSLTAGDWDVSGTVGFETTSSTVVAATVAGLGTTSAAEPPISDSETLAVIYQPSDVPGVGTGAAMPVGPVRAVVAQGATTTYYLIANATFSVSTMGAFGILRARQMG